MRVLCVARHPFLSEHLGRLFQRLGLETVPCVGLRDATRLVRKHDADAVICDYDLLASVPSERWDTDPAFEETPIVAVSLTREPGEAHLLETPGIAGFFYLPTLEPEEARRVFAGLWRKRSAINPPDVLPWAGPVAEFR